LLDQPLGEAPVLLPRNRRHRPHAAAWSRLADDSVTQEDEAVIRHVVYALGSCCSGAMVGLRKFHSYLRENRSTLRLFYAGLRL